MNRREFLIIIGGALTLALSAHAEQKTMPVIGFLSSASSVPFEPFVAAFREGLAKGGYIDGKNVEVEYRWADGHFDRLPAMATELIGKVDVILSSGGNVTALAARDVTHTIPIVFVSGGDPVEDGLVNSLSRPGGNVTGITFMAVDLVAKRLELLSELVPQASTIALLVNPRRPQYERIIHDTQQAARDINVKILVLTAGTEREIDAAFSSLVEHHTSALLVGADVFFNNQRQQLVDLAARYSVPVLYDNRESVLIGGLISYGPRIAAAYFQAGLYVALILKGTTLTDLPVQQSPKFELVVDLKTAKTLGLRIPSTVFARADEVIE